MATPGPAADFPSELPAGMAQPERRYRLQTGYYAVHGRAPDIPAAGAVLVLNRGQVAVFPGHPLEGHSEEVGPVYATPDGQLTVPTGRVFVRFTAGTSASHRRDDLEHAGFDLVEVPGYAPHTAWVKARRGGIAASLQKIANLETIAGVENVEPQMLMERAKR